VSDELKLLAGVLPLLSLLIFRLLRLAVEKLNLQASIVASMRASAKTRFNLFTLISPSLFLVDIEEPEMKTETTLARKL
jgi:hypothetical protein